MAESAVQLRYAEKVTLFCDGIDPFLLPASDFSPTVLPKNVQYFDIYNYCINTSCTYTMETFRSYKSMEAYKWFESGWIQNIGSKIVSAGLLISAHVISLNFNYYVLLNFYILFFISG